MLRSITAGGGGSISAGLFASVIDGFQRVLKLVWQATVLEFGSHKRPRGKKGFGSQR